MAAVSRWDIINHYVKLVDAKSYLEIGLADGGNFKRIEVDRKVSVDPKKACKATHVMGSDEFFAQNEELFDIIFVDGLHTQAQVTRDIANACYSITDHGVIILHDLNPKKEEIQEPKPTKGNSEWTGDGWKAWVLARAYMNYVTMFVIDTDYGCGVIRVGTQKLFDVNCNELNWDWLCKHRKEALNLLSIEEWERIKNN